MTPGSEIQNLASTHARTDTHKEMFFRSDVEVFLFCFPFSLSLSLSDILNLQKGLPAHEFLIYVFTLAEGLHHGVDVQ